MNEYCNIEIQKLASSAASGRYLLGYNGKFFEANSYVVELINCLQEYADEDVAISKYIEKRQGKYTKKQVKGLQEMKVWIWASGTMYRLEKPLSKYQKS